MLIIRATKVRIIFDNKNPFNGRMIKNPLFLKKIHVCFFQLTENNIDIQEEDNTFDMEQCLIKFKKHCEEIYTDKKLKFLEREIKLSM